MNEYTIQELTEQTGLPRRTIHFYSQQGILPGPDGAGLSARYFDEHLVRLKLIPHLRRRGLRLDEIRKLFQETDPQALADLLAQEEKNATPPILPPPAPLAGMRLIHYPLAAGMTLVVPEETETRHPGLVNRILKAIQIVSSQ
jgi:DNA-binding transcriptional MerR regulator